MRVHERCHPSTELARHIWLALPYLNDLESADQVGQDLAELELADLDALEQVESLEWLRFDLEVERLG